MLSYVCTCCPLHQGHLYYSKTTPTHHNSSVKTQCHLLENTRWASQISLVVPSFVLPLTLRRYLFQRLSHRSWIVMTFVSLTKWLAPEQTSFLFHNALPLVYLAFCLAYRWLTSVLRRKEGEKEERRPSFGMQTEESHPAYSPLDCGISKELMFPPWLVAQK